MSGLHNQIPNAFFLNAFLKKLLGLSIGTFIIAIVILSWVPPVSKDALTHHLAIPKLFIQNGGITEIPSLIVSYYPMNLELLYLIPLYFGNDILPKYIHFTFGLLTAGLLYLYLKRRIDTISGLLGALFFLSLPIVVKLSITAYVDLGLVFFSFTSLLLFMRWIDCTFEIKYLIWSAIVCGLALGTKYNGLITLCIIALLVPLIYNRKTDGNMLGQFKAGGYGFIFVTIALLVYSPWMIRNVVWTDNPVYPLFQKWFNPSINEAGYPMSYFALRSDIYNETWLDIALIPIRIFFQGEDGSPQWFDGKLNPILFFMPFLAYLGFNDSSKKIRTEKWILTFFTVLFIAFTFFQRDMRIRYITPILPPLVILSVFGIQSFMTWIKDHASIPLRKMATAGIFVTVISFFCLNALYVAAQFKQVQPHSYIAGKVGREEYIKRFRKEYAALQYANETLSETTKILGLFIGGRRYYSDRELIFEEELFRKIVQGTPSASSIVFELEVRQITHLLIRYDLFNIWVETNFNDATKEKLRLFFGKHVISLFSEGGYGLFELKPLPI